MIKPILKIELPNEIPVEDREAMAKSLENSPITEQYHVLIIYSPTSHVVMEIITASDINLHLTDTPIIP